MPRDFIMELR